MVWDAVRRARFACAGIALLLAACGGGAGPDPLSTAPGLSVNPASVAFTAFQYGPLPGPQSIQIALSRVDAVFVFAGIPATPVPTWLSQNPTVSGSGSNRTLTGNVTTTSLAPGTYTTTVRISIADINQKILAFRDVLVSYTVQPPEPTLTVSTGLLTFNALSGGVVPAPQQLTLSTQDSQSLDYSTSISYTNGAAAGWLSAPPGTAPATINVGVNTADLTPGFYSATLFLRTAAQLAIILVTYTVETSTLTLSPAAPSFVIDTTSVGSALSQTVGTGSTGLPLSWTAASSQPWVTVSPTSGSSGAAVTLSLVPAQLEAFDAGVRSATVTFAYTPHKLPPTSVPLAVSLNLQIPKVVSVNPYVATSGTSLEVILRGSGFGSPGGTAMNFGGIPGTNATLASDTELRVTHPSFAAGSYRVTVPNQLGIVRSTTDLVVVDAPVYAATTLPNPFGFSDMQKVLYDAERKALIVATGGNILRYAFDGSVWSTTPTIVGVPGPLDDVAATLDGKRLLVTSGNAIREFDMATLAAGTSTSTNLFPLRFLNRLAVANDGTAIVTTGISGSGDTETFRYSVADRTLTMNPSNDNLALADAGGSADGSLLVIPQNGTSPAPRVYTYNASTSTLSPTNFSVNASFPVLDRRATRILLDGFSVYDRNFQLLGTIGGSSRESQTLSPDGRRAYAADRLSPDRTTVVPTVLRTYDLAAAPGGKFPEIGMGTTFASDIGRAVMTVSPDGGTVFIAGTAGILVVPAP